MNCSPADFMMAALTPMPTRASRSLSEGGLLDAEAIAWLGSNGIDLARIASPIAPRRARVLFNAGRYEFSPLGEDSFLLPVIDGGTLIDFAAWAPATGDLATRLGRGVLLGADQVGWSPTGDQTNVPPLKVHRSPLGWLRAGRHGVVILDAEAAAGRLSRIVVVGENRRHCSELRRVLRPPSAIVREVAA